MGSFYTNVTLRTTDRDRVMRDLAARGAAAYVSRPERGALVVFERAAEMQDPAVLDEMAAGLSARLGCAALAVTNHDDSALLYSLFEGGRQVDAYNSAPDTFDEELDESDRGGDPERLARAFGVPDRAPQLAAILGVGGEEQDFVFETDRHEQLVRALGLPGCAVGTGYTYLGRGEYPAAYRREDFERVGGG